MFPQYKTFYLRILLISDGAPYHVVRYVLVINETLHTRQVQHGLHFLLSVLIEKPFSDRPSTIEKNADRMDEYSVETFRVIVLKEGIKGGLVRGRWIPWDGFL